MINQFEKIDEIEIIQKKYFENYLMRYVYDFKNASFNSTNIVNKND